MLGRIRKNSIGNNTDTGNNNNNKNSDDDVPLNTSYETIETSSQVTAYSREEHVSRYTRRKSENGSELSSNISNPASSTTRSKASSFLVNLKSLSILKQRQQNSNLNNANKNVSAAAAASLYANKMLNDDDEWEYDDDGDDDSLIYDAYLSVQPSSCSSCSSEYMTIEESSIEQPIEQQQQQQQQRWIMRESTIPTSNVAAKNRMMKQETRKALTESLADIDDVDDDMFTSSSASAAYCKHIMGPLKNTTSFNTAASSRWMDDNPSDEEKSFKRRGARDKDETSTIYSSEGEGYVTSSLVSPSLLGPYNNSNMAITEDSLLPPMPTEEEMMKTIRDVVTIQHVIESQQVLEEQQQQQEQQQQKQQEQQQQKQQEKQDEIAKSGQGKDYQDEEYYYDDDVEVEVTDPSMLSKIKESYDVSPTKGDQRRKRILCPLLCSSIFLILVGISIFLIADGDKKKKHIEIAIDTNLAGIAVTTPDNNWTTVSTKIPSASPIMITATTTSPSSSNNNNQIPDVDVDDDDYYLIVEGETREPNTNPTKIPSKSSSKKPSRNPTISPTLNPWIPLTMNPSMSLSRVLSSNPSDQPSTGPTEKPTNRPSRSPTIPTTLAPAPIPTRSPTFEPTRNPSLSPAITMNTPTAKVLTTTSPTNVPMYGWIPLLPSIPQPTQVSTPCVDEISVNKVCYDDIENDSIVVEINVCNPKNNDWIGIYRDGVDLQNLDDNFAAWRWTCGNQNCGGLPTYYAVIAFRAGNLNLGTTYRAHLIQDSPTPYQSSVVSDAFQITTQNNCD